MFSPLANAIRFLSMDAIQKANSGHPGAPMGMAEMATVLWRQFVRHNPKNPHFFNRDRVVLSNGHASMLLYSVLHLTGYDVSVEDLKQFRQFKSKTPGHPEYSYTPGVETTTGPLGQGLANAVGLALAEQLLAKSFNRPSFNVVDHHTYAFVGDGCLMEGISHEAASLAGTLALGKLIVLYDDNNISIDGKVDGWFTEDIPKRFESYGWQVIANVDGHDMEALTRAIESAQNDARPSIICCKTRIGQGAATKTGSHKTHGSPLGADEILATRTGLKWAHEAFHIDADTYAQWDATAQGADTERAWTELFGRYADSYPELAKELTRRIQGRLPETFQADMDAALQAVVRQHENLATRQASQHAISAIAGLLPELVGGSADLTPSNLTDWPGSVSVKPSEGGNYIHYGVREFAMGAITNGLALHGGLKPFSATFLMFSEYARNALRMAALMKINPVFVFTHDSIGLGEDGPTHQPVEQLATLRMIPNMQVWRPCDTVESFVAWSEAVQAALPSCLVFSRQSLPFFERNAQQLDCIRRGGYVLKATENAQAVLIATGSEVALAAKAQAKLADAGVFVSLVSLPSTNVFDRQEKSYRDSVLPPGLPKIAIEAGVSDFWRKYVGLDGVVIGMDTFGESAPAEVLFEHFGFTVENVAAQVKALLNA